MINKEKLILNIKTDLFNLNEAITGLNKSFEKCLDLIDKQEKTFENYESIDSIIIKFARISDIYTQKILTSLMILSIEKPEGFIDKVNICEKLGIIDSAEELSVIREIRNYTSHEYASSMVNTIFKSIMKHIPILLNNIKTTKQYLKKFDI
jgi:uncharacterized protein YutE (UPF0331/DUF86 family)